jgi:hypothetical protein
MKLKIDIARRKWTNENTGRVYHPEMKSCKPRNRIKKIKVEGIDGIPAEILKVDLNVIFWPPCIKDSGRRKTAV